MTPPPTTTADVLERVVQRRGGWFVTGCEWSGPWATQLAAEFASGGEYSRAHEEERRVRQNPLARAQVHP